MSNTLTDKDFYTGIEQDLLNRLADALCCEDVPVFQDRDADGSTEFLVCRNSATAREILDDSPATWEVRGGSLIVTVRHPGRDE